jgi:hypothetical protein
MSSPEEEKNPVFPMTLDLRFPPPGTGIDPVRPERLP